VIVKLRDRGWKEEGSRGFTPFMEITTRFAVSTAVTLKTAGLWKVACSVKGT
jgi:hypothetical protein